MANEIMNGISGLPATPQINVSASQDGVAIGQVYGNINLEVGAELLSLLQKMTGTDTASHAADWAVLNTEQFNLFVVEGEKYNCGCFSIAKRTALRKYTSEAHAEHFKSLSPAVIEELKNMPCIFATRNQDFKTARQNYPAFLGKLTEITCQGEQIKFKFVVCGKLPQQFINNNIALFNLLSAPVRNQLDEEHWSIRTGNLLDIADRIGVEIN